MGRYCAGDECRVWLADHLEFCTEHRAAFERTLAENLREVQAKLAAYSLFAEWQEKHPEYKEDV